jgi:hypothetical protein
MKQQVEDGFEFGNFDMKALILDKFEMLTNFCEICLNKALVQGTF